jgi:GrpB-like predicted nucleotidyltransferase (UPF0157 family)
MLTPIPVELLPHDPHFAELAVQEAERLKRVLGESLLTVHHVGSTAITGIHAKPILDLMPVVVELPALDERRAEVEMLGYAWWGEFGLPGRRYCTLSDPETGKRRIQLHCYAQGSSEIDRHLAFRDYLRAHPAIAQAYDREKERCRSRHPDNSYEYNDCKNDWIKAVERETLRLCLAQKP